MPDVKIILGLPYSGKIDVWSLGCVLVEQFTGNVLFANDSVQTILARMISVLGPFPERMLQEGTDVDKYFTEDRRAVFEEVKGDAGGQPDMWGAAGVAPRCKRPPPPPCLSLSHTHMHPHTQNAVSSTALSPPRFAASWVRMTSTFLTFWPASCRWTLRSDPAPLQPCSTLGWRSKCPFLPTPFRGQKQGNSAPTQIINISHPLSTTSSQQPSSSGGPARPARLRA